MAWYNWFLPKNSPTSSSLSGSVYDFNPLIYNDKENLAQAFAEICYENIVTALRYGIPLLLSTKLAGSMCQNLKRYWTSSQSSRPADRSWREKTRALIRGLGKTTGIFVLPQVISHYLYELGFKTWEGGKTLGVAALRPWMQKLVDLAYPYLTKSITRMFVFGGEGSWITMLVGKPLASTRDLFNSFIHTKTWSEINAPYVYGAQSWLADTVASTLTTTRDIIWGMGQVGAYIFGGPDKWVSGFQSACEYFAPQMSTLYDWGGKVAELAADWLKFGLKNAWGGVKYGLWSQANVIAQATNTSVPAVCAAEGALLALGSYFIVPPLWERYWHNPNLVVNNVNNNPGWPQLLNMFRGGKGADNAANNENPATQAGNEHKPVHQRNKSA